MKLKTLFVTTALTSSAFAGEVAPAPTDDTASACDLWKSIGKVYESPENPYIQEVELSGRVHWQYGYTEGESVEGQDFDEQYTELRRLRAGVEVHFLNKFELEASVNLEQGGPDNHRFGMEDFDQVTLTYVAGDVLGLENVELTYGRQRFVLGAESHISSRKIKTVERSNIGNFFTSGKRPTGLSISAEKEEFEFTAAVYSTEDDSDFIGGWNDDQSYYFGVERGGWQADFLYNDVQTTAGAKAGSVEAVGDDIFEYRWATSLGYTAEIGRWEVLLNGIYGEQLNNEEVYGVVVMPSTFLIEDKLEFVARYQYAGSEGDNLELTKRYAGEAGNPEKGEDGSENHTVYTGLNYYLCDDRAKVMAGVEYETLERENREKANAVTFWTALRIYF